MNVIYSSTCSLRHSLIYDEFGLWNSRPASAAPIRYKLDVGSRSLCAWGMATSTDRVKLSWMDMTGMSTHADATSASPRDKTDRRLVEQPAAGLDKAG